MKEVTRIYTCEVTRVFHTPDDNTPITPFPEPIQREVAEHFRTVLGADDVVIVKTQNFVREV